MSFALVFVAGNPDQPLTPGHLAQAEHVLDEQGVRLYADPHWLHIHKAAELTLDLHPERPVLDALRRSFDTDAIDVFVTPLASRRKHLLVADMDATIVTGETLDELAAKAGLGEEIAAITGRAMRGELDFHAALKERVSRLKGLSATTLHTTLEETLFSPGAETLVRVMRAHGATCVLASGGFTFFTGAIAARAGFSSHHGNELEIENGQLTGRVIPPILDKDAKLRFLNQYRERLGLDIDATMAVGDGANDLPMLDGAGLGLGYRPKPVVLEAIENCIVHSDLTSGLYIQGYTWQDIGQVLTSDTDCAPTPH